MILQTIKVKDLNENVKELLKGGKTSISSELYLDKYAPKNIPFNRVLYVVIGKELVAVKILMAAYFTNFEDNATEKFAKCIRGKHDIGGWCLLIQTPYGVEWRNDLSYHKRFFFSKEEYFAHLENGRGGFEIEHEMLGHIIGKFPGSRLSFNQSWKWNGHCAERTSSYIKCLVINENGVNVILSRSQNEFWSKEECLKAHLEGMKIVEFPEIENSIKVSIEVVPNEPIIHTLTFVEK